MDTEGSLPWGKTAGAWSWRIDGSPQRGYSHDHHYWTSVHRGIPRKEKTNTENFSRKNQETSDISRGSKRPLVAVEEWSSHEELLRPPEINRNGGWQCRNDADDSTEGHNSRRYPTRPVDHCYFTNLSGEPYTIAKVIEGLIERKATWKFLATEKGLELSRQRLWIINHSFSQ
jgi:hypothetical protein